MKLKYVPLPNFGVPTEVPTLSKSIYENRVETFYESVDNDWIVVYADREHFGNLYYLTGLDPRFEEVLLVLGPDKKVYFLSGNEMVGMEYTAESVLDIEPVLVQTFNLMGQDYSKAPRLDKILKEVGIKSDDSVGVVGWKYLEEEELVPNTSNIYIPAMILETINSLIDKPAEDVTEVLLHPTTGLRSINEVDEIPLLEYGASRSSLAIQNIIENTEVGMTELQAVSHMNYAGEPLSAHVMFATGQGKFAGLRSPTGKKIELGDGVFTAIGYWGGLSARGGLIDEYDERFLEDLAIPYFKGVAKWYETAKIGVTSKELYNAVTDTLAEGGLKPALNPGHLTSAEEWLHSSVQPDNDTEIKSGNAYQLDIIPKPLDPGENVNNEDAVFFADKEMREELAEKYPEVWSRIVARQKFLREEIGLDIDDSLLPLSTNPGYYVPFWLSPNKVIVPK